MKKLLFILLLLHIYKLYSQEASGKYAPSSGTSSFINSYSDQPDLYTGTNTFSIPIYTLTDGDSFSHNVSLSYRSNGVNIEEVPDWTGTDWTLNAGGVISFSLDRFTNIYQINFRIPGYSGRFPLDFSKLINEGILNSTTPIVIEYEDLRVQLTPEVFGYKGSCDPFYSNEIRTPTYTAKFDMGVGQDDFDTNKIAFLNSNDELNPHRPIPPNIEVPLLKEEFDDRNFQLLPTAVYMSSIDYTDGIAYFDYQHVYTEYTGANRYSYNYQYLASFPDRNQTIYQISYHAYMKPVLTRIRTRKNVVEFITQSTPNNGVTDSGLLLKEIVVKALHEEITTSPQNISVTYNELVRYQLDYEIYKSDISHLFPVFHSEDSQRSRNYYRSELAEFQNGRPYLRRVAQVGINRTQKDLHSFDYYNPMLLPEKNTYHIGPLGKYLEYTHLGNPLDNIYHYQIGLAHGISYNQNIIDMNKLNNLGLTAYDKHPNWEVAKHWNSFDPSTDVNGKNATARTDAQVDALLNPNMELPQQPSWSNTHFGMLKEVVLPSGAMIEYTYDNRIFGSLLASKTYKNTDNSVKRQLNYIYADGAIPKGIVPLSYLAPTHPSFSKTNKNGSFFRINGRIGFGHVTEVTVGGPTKTYSFTTAADHDNEEAFFTHSARDPNIFYPYKYVDPTFPPSWNQPPDVCIGQNIDYESKRGLLKRTEIRDANNRLVFTKELNYDFFTYQTFRKAIQFLDFQNQENYTSIAYQPIIGYQIRDETIRNYYQNGTQQIERISNYTYENNNLKKYPTGISKILADGTSVFKEVAYDAKGALHVETTYINGIYQQKLDFSNFIGFMNKRPTQTKADYGAGWVDQTTSILENGRLVQVASKGNQIHNRATYMYDDRDRVIETHENGYLVSENIYNDLDQLDHTINVDGKSNSYVYDEFGRLVEVFDQDGNMLEKKEYIEPLGYTIPIVGPSTFCRDETMIFTIDFPTQLDILDATITWSSSNPNVTIHSSVSGGQEAIVSSSSCSDFELVCTVTMSDGLVVNGKKEIQLNYVPPITWVNNEHTINLTIDLSTNSNCSLCNIAESDILSVQSWITYNETEGFYNGTSYRFGHSRVLAADANWHSPNILIKDTPGASFSPVVLQFANGLDIEDLELLTMVEEDYSGELKLNIKLVTKYHGDYIYSLPYNTAAR